MQNVNENAVVIATIMNSIFNFVKTTNDSAKNNLREKRKINNSLTKSSIMQASKDLVMSFPVICSTSLSPQTAVMIQRAIELNCVTTLQMIFASASLTGDNGVEVIKQWHNNMSGDISMDDYFDYIESLGNGIGDGIKSGLSTLHNSTDYVKKYGERMIAECKRNEVYYPISNYNESSLLSYELSNGRDGNINIKVVNEANTKPVVDPDGLISIPYDDPTSPSGKNIMRITPTQYNEWQQNAKKIGTGLDAIAKMKANELQAKKDEESIANDKERLKNDAEKIAIAKLDSRHGYLQKQLLDSDIKKANELVPSMMVIRYYTKSVNSNGVAVQEEFVAGVKARLIGCDSMEIIDRIRLALENKVDLKNFIRATTGEIRFCKDFLLAIDQAKIEAKRNSKLSKTSPIWRSLQNRSTKSTFKRINRNTNTAAAITSLVISAEEVNRLNTIYNIDLYNISKARQIMEAYNFMEIVIVDEALEVARFLLDNGDKYFQDYSFTALRKEASESEMKKLINIVSATNR